MLINLLKSFFLFSLIYLPLEGYSEDFDDEVAEADPYIELLNNINKKFCSASDMKTYRSLNTYSSSERMYIPMLGDIVDKTTIKEHLPLLELKLKWVDRLYQKLLLKSGKVSLNEEIKDLNHLVELNLKAKYAYEVSGDRSRKNLNQAKKTMLGIKLSYDKILDKVFYLKNFHFPVDHTRNRVIFERLKKETNKQAANRVFFKRKVYEEGAPQSKSRSDKHVRMVIDNLSSELSKFENFLSERVLSDLFWLMRVFKKSSKFLSINKYRSYALKWRMNLSKKLNNYKSLLKEGSITHEYVVKKYKERSFANFVYLKESEVYRYLSMQDEKLQREYVLDTILYNEVGGLDPDNQYKKDIVNTVLNRVQSSKFNILKPEAPIVKFFDKRKVDTKSPWLNILFNKGEFSFTYHYFSAAKHIFCPPMTNLGRRLRSKNRSFWKKYLKKKRSKKEAKPFYYFSRVSMPGRVDMTKVWTHAKPIVKKLGEKISIKTQEVKDLKQGNYFYSFVENGKKYLVFRNKNNNKLYAIDKLNGISEAYHLKDEELFKFFSLNT